MKKTIAVQTFWKSDFNYGQLLQGYAMQSFLQMHGHDSYIIRFDSLLSKIKELFMLITKFGFVKQLRQRKLRNFDDFRKNIKYSKQLYKSYREIKCAPPEADVYLVGSDQVWAYMHNLERRKAYLLQFGNSSVRRISYAASFGRDSLGDDLNDFSQALSHFSYLGVREESGQIICKNLGLMSSWVVDPVALLSVNQWRAIESPTELSVNDMSLFIYTLTNNSDLYNYCNLKFKDKFTLYYTNSSEFGDEECHFFPSPTQWLYVIDKSQFVITDSFHCTLFCILFNKPFITIARKDGKSMSNRLTSLLSRLGLSNRYIEDRDIIENKIKYNIDWQQVNEKLSSWIKYSQAELLKAIE